jgi:hypothetical protein
MRLNLRHYMNPLHIYCRLRNLGVPKGIARYVCIRYEHFIYKYVFEKEP